MGHNELQTELDRQHKNTSEESPEQALFPKKDQVLQCVQQTTGAVLVVDCSQQFFFLSMVWSNGGTAKHLNIYQ